MNLLTTKQVAKLLGINENTLANMRSKGTGPIFCKLSGRSVKYKEEDVKKYIEESRRSSTNVKPRSVKKSGFFS